MNFNLKNLGGAGIIALTGFLFFILVLPQFNKIQSFREAIKTREEVFAEKKDLIAGIASLKDQYSSRETEIKKLSVLIPKSQTVQEIISSIDSISQQAGLELRNLGTAVKDEDREAAGLKRIIVVEMLLAGQYPSFFSFVNLLEKNLRIFDVKEVTITSDVIAVGLPLLNFRVTAETYFIK